MAAPVCPLGVPVVVFEVALRRGWSLKTQQLGAIPGHFDCPRDGDVGFGPAALGSHGHLVDHPATRLRPGRWVDRPLRRASSSFREPVRDQPAIPPMWWGRLFSQTVLGEFDPGSGRTLAACLTHASRAERLLREYSSGERVSNTWVICPGHRNNQWKRWLMPDEVPTPRGRYQR